MSEQIHISMFEVVDSPFCVASSDGQKIFDLLTAALESDRNISLSFRDVSVFTGAFMNAAIGQLYGTFSEEQIRSRLKVVDAEPDDLALVERVGENAKLYYKDPERYDRIVREVLEEDDE